MRIGRNKKAQETARLRQAHDVEDLAKPRNFLYSARRSEEQLNVGRKEEKRKVQNANQSTGMLWLERLGLLLLLVAVIASFYNILRLSPQSTVLPYSKADSNAVLFNKNVYQSTVDKVLATSVWNRNKLTIDTAKIDRELKSQFPEIANVSVALPVLSHSPMVYIQIAQFALVLQTQSYGAYIIDSNGNAILKSSDNPVVAQRLSLPTVVDNSGIPVELGKQVLPVSSITFIQIVTGELTAKHYTVESMSLPPSSGELDVRLVGQPYEIKFNLENNDPQQQAGTFLAIINQLQKQGITPAQYVDVRVDGRGYYQ